MADIPRTTNDSTLYDENGNAVNVVLIDGEYRLSTDSIINPFPGISFNSFLAIDVSGGSTDMNVDGSSTPVTFIAQPPTGKIWYIHTIDVVLEDTAMSFAKFGGIAIPLTNGVDFKVKQNGASEITLANIKRNGDFYTFANDAFIESSTTTDILVAHVRTKVNTGTTFKLTDSNSEFFKAVVNDNLTNINKFQVLIRGYEVNE